MPQWWPVRIIVQGSEAPVTGWLLVIWSPVPEWTLPVRCAVLLAPLLLCHVAVSGNLHLRLRAVLPPLLVTLLFGVIAELALAFMPLEARPFIYFQF